MKKNISIWWKNTKKTNPLFKDVKEYNKYILSLICIFILVLTGIISYNLTNTSYAKWNSSVESNNILKLSVEEDSYALSFAKRNVGQNGLELVTHTIDDTLQVTSDFATEYRYRGGTVNNYVTFNNETWRIIGIIPTEDTDSNIEYRFKLIRDESIGEYYWGYGTNDWTTATLNTYLNGDYYNALSTTSQNMIGTTKYYLGGYPHSLEVTSDTMWQYERKKENSSTICNETDDESYYDYGIIGCYFYKTNPIMQNDVSKKIALMYTSDYGYGASSECTSNLGSYSDSKNCITTNNWLDKSQDEWLMAQETYRGTWASRTTSNSNVDSACIFNFSLAVRPVLTLSSSVKISSGSGTNSNPYTLSIE